MGCFFVKRLVVYVPFSYFAWFEEDGANCTIQLAVWLFKFFECVTD